VIIRAQIALTLMGAGMFIYGVAKENEILRIAAIGTIAVALILRFFRGRFRG
jgi:hypothetical protein